MSIIPIVIDRHRNSSSI